MVWHGVVYQRGAQLERCYRIFGVTSLFLRLKNEVVGHSHRVSLQVFNENSLDVRSLIIHVWVTVQKISILYFI